MGRTVRTYNTLKNTWTKPNTSVESFFVSYAVRGPIVCPSYGLEQGVPRIGPISGPVSEPSPLNAVWRKEFAEGRL